MRVELWALARGPILLLDVDLVRLLHAVTFHDNLVGMAFELHSEQNGVECHLVARDAADAEPVEASSREGWKRVDLQGSVVFEYEGMDATAIYSKIADSLLRSEISCDGGIISLDQIHICRHAKMTKRGAPTSGRASGPDAVDISVPVDADEYLCEFREFIDVLESGRIESSVNSLETSLATAEILDEIRRQAGVVFPGD